MKFVLLNLKIAEELVFFGVVSWLALDIVIRRHFQLVPHIRLIKLFFTVQNPLDRSTDILIQLGDHALLLLILADALANKLVAAIDHLLVQLQFFVLPRQRLLQCFHFAWVKFHQLILLF